jgi:hypothetical protein
MSSAELAIVCALNLLGRSADSFPPIRILDERPMTASADAEAFADPRDRTINLIVVAPAVAAAREAAASQPRCGKWRAFALLASILIHEEWHLLNGPDERPAYQAQLTTLHALGLNPESREYHRVKRAMAVALQRERTRSRPHTVIAAVP